MAGEECTHVVVHVSSTQQEDAIVVGKLSLVDVGAVSTDMRAIVDIVVSVHEPNARNPVPGLLGPVSIGLVVGVASQPCTEVEEASVRNAWRVLVLITTVSLALRWLTVLVIVTVIRQGNLPAKTTIAGTIMSYGVCLCVEDGLSQG